MPNPHYFFLPSPSGWSNHKLALLLSILLYLPFQSTAQYRPMLEEGSEWYHYFWFEASCNHELRVQGDTTINGKDYKVVLNERDLCNFEEKTFVREDLETRQVYLFYFDTTEIMILRLYPRARRYDRKHLSILRV